MAMHPYKAIHHLPRRRDRHLVLRGTRTWDIFEGMETARHFTPQILERCFGPVLACLLVEQREHCGLYRAPKTGRDA